MFIKSNQNHLLRSPFLPLAGQIAHGIPEAVIEVSVKQVFLKISQSSQENTCARSSFLIKLQTSRPQLY